MKGASGIKTKFTSLLAIVAKAAMKPDSLPMSFTSPTPPMRARFGIVERLGFYPADDLARIDATLPSGGTGAGAAYDPTRRPA